LISATEGEDVGVLRTFATRHGPGPFPTYREGFNLLVEKGENNEWNAWQKHFRYGYLDLPLLKYALHANHGVDWLAVTHIDKLALLPSWHVCRAYSPGTAGNSAHRRNHGAPGEHDLERAQR
jgi:adenylosuccinate synthase